MAQTLKRIICNLIFFLIGGKYLFIYLGNCPKVIVHEFPT